jgi:outer membrane protein assembly complex protein YaeT
MKPTPNKLIAHGWSAVAVALLLAGDVWPQGLPGGGMSRASAPDPIGRTRAVVNDDDVVALKSAQGPNVAAVEIVGNKTVSRERIESLIRTRAGRPYSDALVKSDVANLMRRSLFYDVQVRTRDTADGRIVQYQVLERPVIQSVEFVGNGVFSNDKLVEFTGLRAGGPMDPALNKSAAAEIERRYREKGYPFAQIELLEGGRQDDTRVSIRISEGPKTKVGAIRFEGVQFINHAVLKTKLKSGQFFGVGRVGFGGAYDPELVDEDVAALRAYYRSHGFLDVKISHRKDFSDDRSRVNLTYMIEEGPRFRIGDVQIAGAQRFDENRLKETIVLAGGKNFNEAELRKDAQSLKDTFGRNGFVKAEVLPDLRFREEPGVVDVVFKVQEDQPKQVGNIRIEGNTHTKKSVILKWMDLESGTLLDSTKLRDAQIRLMSSRLFDEQSPPEIVFDDASFDPSSPYQDLVVKLREGATGSLMFGVGVNSDAGVGGSLVLHERNFDLFRLPTSWSDLWSGSAFRGGGQELRVEAVPGNLVHRYAVTHLEPFLFGTDLNLQSSGYYYRRLFTNYAEQRTGGRFTLGYRLDRYWQASLGLRLEDVGISRPSIPAPADLVSALGNHFLYGPRVALSHDTRDSQLNPSKGHFVELGYEHTFGDFTFPRFDVSARQYFKVWERRDGSGRHVLSVRGQFGWTDESTPIFERFYAGGFQTLRGFSFRGIGPVEFDQKVGGSFMLLSGLEYYLPLTADDNVGWVFFSDMGTVERKLEILDYRVTAGFGLRVRVPGMGPVPLAFDFGFPVVKTALDDTQVFSFSVGIFR